MSNEDPTGQAATSAAQVAMAGLTVGEAVVRARRDRRVADQHRQEAARRAEERSERGLRRVERAVETPGGRADAATAAREQRTGDELWHAARHSADTPDNPVTTQVDEHREGQRTGEGQTAAAASSDQRAASARSAAAQAAQDYPRRPQSQARRAPHTPTAASPAAPAPRRTR